MSVCVDGNTEWQTLAQHNQSDANTKLEEFIRLTSFTSFIDLQVHTTPPLQPPHQDQGHILSRPRVS